MAGLFRIVRVVRDVVICVGWSGTPCGLTEDAHEAPEGRTGSGPGR